MSGDKRLISRREVFRIGAAGGMALVAKPGRAKDMSGKTNRRPNVLFVNTDQQRFDALSCAGNPCVSTPNLDRLASEGVRFTSAVTPSAMCIPARCAWATGLSIHATGCINTTDPKSMDFHSGSFDQNLAKAGYHTEYHGRYHAPLPLAECYKNPITLGFTKPYQAHLKKTLGEPPACKDGELVGLLAKWPYKPDPLDARFANIWPDHPEYQGCIHFGTTSVPAEHTYSAYVADQTIDALKRLKDVPFSITSAFLAPHHPWYLPKRWAGSVDPKKMREPATLNDKRENTPYSDFFWQLPEVYRKHLGLFHARYYELLQEADYHIGRILKALDDLGLAENTLVIFAADHGEMLGDHGLTQKFVAYQESIRIPMMMRLPGKIAAGKLVDHPASSVDIFATIFDYLGLECPPQHGNSVRPLVEGRTDDYPDYVFSEFGLDAGIGYISFISRQWKYVWTLAPGAMDMLYNIEEDPHELNNLLGANPDREKHLPKAREIRKAMLDRMEQIKHPYLEKLAASEIG